MEKKCSYCYQIIPKWSSTTNEKGIFHKKCWGFMQSVANGDREQKMVDLLDSGKSLQEVGDMYGMTRERVRQLVKKRGYISDVRKHRKRVIYKFVCNNCREFFYTLVGRVREREPLFCSGPCHGEMAHKLIADKKAVRLKTDNSRRYFGKKYKMTSYKDEHGVWQTRSVHRATMEKHLGRKLHRNENVVHKDGDVFNNDISNLEIVTPQEVARRRSQGWTKNLKPILVERMLVDPEEQKRLLTLK